MSVIKQERGKALENPIEKFKMEVEEIIEKQGDDTKFRNISDEWMVKSIDHKSSYLYRWLGRPIIQYPADIIQMQELIWEIQPDIIIETGIAHGGSMIFYASMLQLLDSCLGEKKRQVLGVDIDIRSHNRVLIEKHPMYKYITMLEGSSIDDDIVEKVYKIAAQYTNPLVILDSNHNNNHVLEECRMYCGLVKKGSYMVVMDTIGELYYKTIAERDEPLMEHAIRPWGLGTNALNGLQDFLKENDEFEPDHRIDNKLLLSCAPGGYLKRIK